MGGNLRGLMKLDDPARQYERLDEPARQFRLFDEPARQFGLFDEPARQFELLDEPARLVEINEKIDSLLVDQRRHQTDSLPFPGTDSKNKKDQYNSKNKVKFSKRNKTTKGGRKGQKENGK